jgi:asparagine synthase (glutamine-hydrolysing)
LRFPELPCDEAAYADEVIRHTQVSATTLVPDASRVAIYTEEAERFRDLPSYPNGVVFHPLWREARTRGHRVVLTGLGGDEWFSGALFHRHFDRLRDWRLKRLVTDVRRDIKYYGANQVLRGVLRPLVPPVGMSLWRGCRRLMRGDVFPPWVRPELAARVSLADRLVPAEPPRFRRAAAAEVFYKAALEGNLIHGREIAERSASAHGLEERHPLHDRRVAQFALATPDAHFAEETRRYKVVLGDAARGLLPDSVRLRQSKAEFSCLYAKAFEALGEEDALNASEASSRGWIDIEGARRAYREAKQSGPWHQLATIWMVFAIDLWCRKSSFEQLDDRR